VHSNLYTKSEEIENVTIDRPHVFILGAGASRAAFPDGEHTGKKLPVMDDLVDILELREVFDDYGEKYNGGNFEKIFSDLYAKDSNSGIVHDLEKKISSYFAEMRLPPTPTIYDYLVLCLRPKDVIATFNWDPFLFQALERNHAFTKGPHYYFLHGCAALGFCEKDKKQGRKGHTCSICENPFVATRLLYPIVEKDYSLDPYIESQWRNFQAALKEAFTFTVFGYGAPKADIRAIELMQKAWGPRDDRWLEEIEFIDIVDEDTLLERWDPFIHTHHYRINEDFFSSFVARHPRRSCEVYWEAHIEARFYEENPVPRVETLSELWTWFEGLLRYE